MASARDLDPKRVLATPDLRIADASMLEGGILQVGQAAKLVVHFDLQRPVTRLTCALRVYDTEGRCTFASRLQDHGALPLGAHCAVFYFIASLPVGGYAASFEFVEWVAVSDTDPTLTERLLGLNNLFIEFHVKDNQTPAGLAEGDAEAGYASLPMQSLIMDAPPIPILTCSSRVPSAAATHYFPWPLPGTQFSQAELVDVLHRALCPDIPVYARSGYDPRAVFTPRSTARVFPAGSTLMGTQVGEIHQKGIRSCGVAGYLFFGPYLPIMPGRYRVAFNGEVGPTGASGLKFDVVARQGHVSLVAPQTLFPAPGSFEISYEFEVSSPGYADVEFRLWVESSDDVYVENIEISSMADASTEESGDLDDWVQSLVACSRRLDWMLQQSQVAMVFCPSLGWSPLILALCEQLPQQGAEWVLVVPDGLDADSLPLTKVLIQTRVIKFTEALALPQSVKCSHVVTHSFGFHEEAEKLLRHFSGAQLQLYADGFTPYLLKYNDENSFVGKHKHIVGIYYFDNLPVSYFEYKSISRLVDASAVFKYWAELSEKLIPQSIDLGLDPRNYVVLYLRYWGTGIYEKFTTENIVRALISTLSGQKNSKRIVIVKSDPRIKAEIYPAVTDGLLRAGISTLRFDDYLKIFGIAENKSLLPVEVFFAKGLLCQAKEHFVLDSILGYLIALNPAIRCPTKIIFGVDQKQVDEWEPCNGTEWVKSQTQAYANMVLAGKSVERRGRRSKGTSDVMPQAIELFETEGTFEK